MENVAHGGDCCGISHICGMGRLDNPTKSLNDRIESTIEDLRSDCNCSECRNQEGSHLIEVVLTTRQQEIWDKVLKDRGFNIVTDFVNSNSGNTCYVYHLVEEVET